MIKLISKILRGALLVIIAFGGWPQMAKATTSPLTAYAWQARLLVMVTEPDQSALREAVYSHFSAHACAHNERRLRLLSFLTTDADRADLPDVMQAKTGLWLIGYDGGVKTYGADATLLLQIHQIIDAMPIRRREMRQNPTSCAGL